MGAAQGVVAQRCNTSLNWPVTLGSGCCAKELRRGLRPGGPCVTPVRDHWGRRALCPGVAEGSGGKGGRLTQSELHAHDQVALESRPPSSPPVVGGARRQVFLTLRCDPPAYDLRVHAQVALEGRPPTSQLVVRGRGAGCCRSADQTSGWLTPCWGPGVCGSCRWLRPNTAHRRTVALQEGGRGWGRWPGRRGGKAYSSSTR